METLAADVLEAVRRGGETLHGCETFRLVGDERGKKQEGKFGGERKQNRTSTPLSGNRGQEARDSGIHKDRIKGGGINSGPESGLPGGRTKRWRKSVKQGISKDRKEVNRENGRGQSVQEIREDEI